MNIGERIKNLRIQKNLTQEELGERTNLSKGYISQLERDLSSPSMETFFDLLAVLGCSPKEFFDTKEQEQRVVYRKEATTVYEDEEKGYRLKWPIPESNENEMEPVILHLSEKGAFKTFEPSLAETYAYVMQGAISIQIGNKKYIASAGESLYYRAIAEHQIVNHFAGTSKLLLVVTDSYL